MKLQSRINGMQKINWSSEQVSEGRRELEDMTKESLELYKLKGINSLKKSQEYIIN